MRSFALLGACLVLSACLEGTPDLTGTGAEVSPATAEAERGPPSLGRLWPFGGPEEPGMVEAVTTELPEKMATNDAAPKLAATATEFDVRASTESPQGDPGGFFADLLQPNRKADVVPASLATGGAVADQAEAAAGRVTSACSVDRGALGQQVDQYPATRPTYRLYDTDPDSTLARTHYVTGFTDGCPRRFQAAVALFGSTASHDIARYTPDMADEPLTATDRAYEGIRRRVCRVPQSEDCSGTRRARLDRSTVFITVYSSFETSRTWTDILIHDGQVVASAPRRGP